MTTPYYFTDDATLLGDILKAEWALSPRVCVKPTFTYNPDTDNDTFDYTQGGIQCNITCNLRTSIKRGIGYDGSTDTCNVAIRVRARSDKAIYTVTDEIDRILKAHAIYPGNGWQILECLSVERVFPGRKFSQRYIIYKLTCPWKPRIKPSV